MTTLAAMLALVHPGHGHTDPHSWVHYITEPVHVAVLAAAGGFALVVGLALRRVRKGSDRRRC